MMNSDIIILRSVYGKVGQKYYITPCKDPVTGRFPDCIRPVNSNGDMILSEKDKEHGTIVYPETKVFIIEDGTQFDLKDPWQKAQWEAIKNAPIIVASRDARDSKGNLLIDGAKGQGLGQFRARYGVGELYIENPGVETASRVNRNKLIHEAESWVYNDERGAEGRLTKAKLLGKNMRNMSDNDVVEFLIEIAKRDPNKIINLYTGTDTALRIVVIDAKERHVIISKNKVYMYGDIVLGTTDDSVITFLSQSKNAKLLELITRDTYPELESKKEKKDKVDKK